ncbi:hypothetical protein JKF63_01781 [Porcisia hertigi]|uniref:non-specific serine/threonine protein kinase n=1 Tax=Porcisia hertigi TaxID=2761500 RepID=A0A836HJM2_9TRYP|nr:hypothetical protein JKF63_01781 [Porcisia hertigi]
MLQDARCQLALLLGFGAAVRPDRRRRRAAKCSSSLGVLLKRVHFLLLFIALGVCLMCDVDAQSFLYDPAADLTAGERVPKLTPSQSLALHYTFPGQSLALLAMANGHVHAYDLERGYHVWCSGTGGDMHAVTIEQPPSEEAILRDPLALPFFVRGNSLFTHIPFSTNHQLSTRDTSEGFEELPRYMRPYFFMNISTLLRRQAVFVGGTDVYVTTSVQVADLDLSSGRSVGSRDAHSQGFRSCNFTSSSLDGNSTNESKGVLHNELLPLLHIVRYNIVLHAVKAGEYSWSMRLSQLRMLPHAAIQSSFPPHFSAQASADTSSMSPGDSEREETPRFFSQFVRNMFDYDDVHAMNMSHMRVADQEKKLARVQQASRPLWTSKLQRRRTHAAEYLSRMVSLHQLNASHVSLQSIHDGTTAWTSALPNVTCESCSRGTTAGAPSSDLILVNAAYVWVSGSDEIFRIPVLRWALNSVLEKDGGLHTPSKEDAGIGTHECQPRLLPTSPTGTLLSTSHAAGDLQLVPRLECGHVGFPCGVDRCAVPGWSTDDVEADEREERELAAYYDQHLRWGEQSWSSCSLQEAFTEEVDGRRFPVIGSLTPSRNETSTRGVYSSQRPISPVDYSGAVVKTGLAWRTAAVISFHVLCLAVSIAFLCAGVPPRGQLQRAWTQADRSRDRVSYTSSSRPQSAQLVPQDLLSPSGELSTPFSLVLDSTPMDAHGLLKKPTGQDSAGSDSLHCRDRSHSAVMGHDQFEQLYKSPPHSAWVNPTPEQLYTMMREGDGEKIFSLTDSREATATDATATFPMSRAGLPRSSTEPTAKESQTPVESTLAAVSSSPIGAVAITDPVADACNSSSDDDTIDIDLGERWWLRAQHPPRLRPGTATSDETLSDRVSSFSHSQANTGTDEEGKLFQLHFKVLEKIGFGGEGSVFCVEHRVTHARYAIKAIHIHEQDEERVVQEAVLHSSFDNANVVRFYFCWIEDIAVSTANRLDLCNRDEDGLDTASLSYSDNSLALSTVDNAYHQKNGFGSASMAGDTYRMLFIQMEYFSRGTLADWLRLRTGFFRLEVLQYMKQIGEGLAYLHNQDVLHRDLKPTNIFVSNNNILKIGDFGLAKRRGAAAGSTGDLSSNVVGGHQERSVVGGSPLYCSPEQTRGDPVNKPSDIFSLGIIAVELLCMFTTLHERIRILTDAHQMILPEELEAEFPDEAQLIISMLAKDPLQRPPIRKVLRQINKLIVKLEAQESDEEVEGSLLRYSPDGGEHSISHSGTREVATTEVVDGSVTESATIAVANRAGGTRLLAGPIDQRPLGSLSIDKDHTANSLTSSSCVAICDTLPLPQQERKPRMDSLPVGRPEAATATSIAVPSAVATVQSADGINSAPLGHRVGNRANTYRSRQRVTASPNVETRVGCSMNSEPSMNGAPSQHELFLSDPYGTPTTPVMYVEDADLSTILKRDLQDRSVSASD